MSLYTCSPFLHENASSPVPHVFIRIYTVLFYHLSQDCLSVGLPGQADPLICSPHAWHGRVDARPGVADCLTGHINYMHEALAMCVSK